MAGDVAGDVYHFCAYHQGLKGRGMRILSEKISRKMFESLIAGFMHGHICGLEVVQIILMENVREILERYNLAHRQHLPNLYLYGDPDINKTDNKRILMCTTIKYLKDTKI